MSTMSHRFIWTVELLPFAPSDRILEVGCGHGVALGLVGARLTGGTVTGVDRSAKMTAAAAKRNAAMIEAGRVRVRTASLHELDDAAGSFDLVYALNVASFWNEPARDLGATRRLFAPGGALCLSVQLPPFAKGGATWLADTTATLAAHGFTVTATHTANSDPYPVAAIFAVSQR